jgi:hypothetical protein
MANQLGAYLSKEWGVKVKIDRVNINIDKFVDLEGLFIGDRYGDTLVYAETFRADIDQLLFRKKKLKITSAKLYNPVIKLYRKKEAKNWNYKFLMDYFATEDTTKSEWKFGIDKIDLQNARVYFHDAHKANAPPGIVDFNKLDLYGVTANLTEIKIPKSSFETKIERLALFDRNSGFSLTDLKSKTRITSRGIFLVQPRIKTPNSNIKATKFILRSNSYKDYSNFLTKIKFDAEFVDGNRVSAKDIAYFVPDLQGLERQLAFTSKVKGPISHLKINDFVSNFAPESYLAANIELDGLPNFANTFIIANIDSLKTTTADINGIHLPPYNDTSYINLPENYLALGEMYMNGSFTGFVNDFVAFGDLQSDLGAVRGNLALFEDDSTKRFDYSGDLVATNFGLGRLFELPEVGNITGAVKIDNGYGYTIDDMYAELSGNFEAIDLLGYTYNNIKLYDGTYIKDFYQGKFDIDDEHVQLKFDGYFDDRGKDPKYKFKASVKNAHLHELKMVPEGEDAIICAELNVNASGLDLDHFKGEINADEITVYRKGIDHTLGLMTLETNTTETEKSLTFTSDFLYANMNGRFTFANLSNEFYYLASNVLPSLFDKNNVDPEKLQDSFSFNIVFAENEELIAILDTALHIAPGTKLYGDADFLFTSFDFTLESKEIKYGEYIVDEFEISAINEDDILFVQADADRLSISKEVHFDNFKLASIPYQDNLALKFKWFNDSLDNGNLAASGYVYSPTHYEFTVKANKKKLNSDPKYYDFAILGNQWQITQNSLIEINADTISIDSLILKAHKIGNAVTDQIVLLDGRISKSVEDSLFFYTDNFELAQISPIIGSDDYPITGILNADASLTSLYDMPKFEGKALIDSLTVKKFLVGNVDVTCDYINQDNSIKLNGFIEHTEDSLNISGFIHPLREDDPMDLRLDFKETNLEFVQVFIPESEVGGFSAFANGHLEIRGKYTEPLINGHLDISNGYIMLTYLNTSYYFEGPIDITEDMVQLNGVPIWDEESYYLDLESNGMVYGQLVHTNFKELSYDFDAEVNQMLLLNTNYTHNPLYFGRAYGSGTINIFGYDEKMEINVTAKSEKGTKFFLPLYGADEVTLQSFVHWVNNDTTDSTGYSVELEDITMNFDLEITEDAEVQIIFDPTIGDVMTGRVKGNLEMKIDEFAEFKLYGDLEVVEGEYLFTLYNVINKKFDVKPGGTIRWTSGDPYDAVIDLVAIYKLKAPLYNLVALDDDKYNRKTNVECEMHLQKDLFNPLIEFDIDIPKGDQNVEAALAKLESDEQELLKQFFALMVINNFVAPESESLISSGVNATTADLINNQLSNWLSAFSDDFDLGFNYNPGDLLSNEELALAFETQLLNNKLLLSANIGYSNGNNSNVNSASSIIGDFSLEYKINKEGTFRVRAFNETNDFDVTNNVDSRYTQGVGISYTEDFDTLNEVKLFKGIGNFFGRIFGKKSKQPEIQEEKSEDKKE